MPKPSLKKSSCGVDKRVHAFHKGISPKVNVIRRMEFELMYNDITGEVRGVMNIVVENGPGYSSSNPGRGCLHFT